MISKTRKKVLDELKQLKVRQKCIEKGISFSATTKMEELDDEEMKFCKALDKLKIDCDKNQMMIEKESKGIAREILTKIHRFKKTLIEGDDSLITTHSSDMLEIIAEINSLISENSYICEKEIESLKFQLEKM